MGRKVRERKDRKRDRSGKAGREEGRQGKRRKTFCEPRTLSLSLSGLPGVVVSECVVRAALEEAGHKGAIGEGEREEGREVEVEEEEDTVKGA